MGGMSVSIKRARRFWRRQVRARVSALAARGRAMLGRPPVVHLYSILWNEADMLPFFFRHYDALVDRYFLYDNGSTDASPELLRAHPKVTPGTFTIKGQSFIFESRDFFCEVWKQSRGKADWVIVVDMDEHLYHPEGKAYLTACQRAGITLVPARGYQMVAASFPAPGSYLVESVRDGWPLAQYDKICVFQPGAIDEIGYGPGRHKAKPLGHVVRPPGVELKLLHYKDLGEEYRMRRTAELRARTSEEDRAQGLNVHYFRDTDTIRARFRQSLAEAKSVIEGELPPRR